MFPFPTGCYLCSLMRVVIDISNKKYRLTINEIFFLDKCFQLLLNNYPEHEWILNPFEETKGIISILPMGIKKSLLLGKLNSPLLITTGEAYKNSNRNSKQIFFYNQAFESYKKESGNLQHPELIITSSEVLRKKIIGTYQLNESKVRVIPAAPAEDISVADWSEKLSVKDRYSDGREFFLCFRQIGRTTHWEEILKAFSIFKKWQQSSFRLLVVAEIEPDYKEEFNEKFASYKYRADVKILDPKEDDINRIIPVAFGLISADADYTGLNLLNGFNAEVPVICSPVELFDEEVSGAFLPAISTADELSRQLINLYRDEQLRELLIEKGKQMLSKYSWEQSAEKWTECMGITSKMTDDS
jgi:glycosyltransferase involved in cell wall biosynthesis